MRAIINLMRLMMANDVRTPALQPPLVFEKLGN